MFFISRNRLLSHFINPIIKQCKMQSDRLQKERQMPSLCSFGCLRSFLPARILQQLGVHFVGRQLHVPHNRSSDETVLHTQHVWVSALNHITHNKHIPIVTLFIATFYSEMCSNLYKCLMSSTISSTFEVRVVKGLKSGRKELQWLNTSVTFFPGENQLYRSRPQWEKLFPKNWSIKC